MTDHAAPHQPTANTVLLDEALKNIANAVTRLGFLEGETSSRTVLGQQIESIKIDLQVARLVIEQAKGEA